MSFPPSLPVGRPWPVALGTGFGLGFAMSNCQHDFRRVESVYLRPKPVGDPSCSSFLILDFISGGCSITPKSLGYSLSDHDHCACDFHGNSCVGCAGLVQI